MAFHVLPFPFPSQVLYELLTGFELTRASLEAFLAAPPPAAAAPATAPAWELLRRIFAGEQVIAL